MTLRPSVAQARESLDKGRAKLKKRHRDGSPGVQVCAATTDLLDSVVLDLWESALADLDPSQADALRSEVCLVAHGGYGRRDVAPYSDVDLMIVHAPGAIGRVTPLAGRIMLDVFDSGLQLGQSVRTPRQACGLAMKDAAIFTSLAESRFLAGSVSLFSQFFHKFQKMSRRRRHGLIAGIEEARGEERGQYGETVYLLEPNIKRSPGGLRGIQLLRWVGFARHGVTDPDSLRRLGVLSTQDYCAVRDAGEFLLRLRNEMHFHAGKAHDVLDRAEQVRLAQWAACAGAKGLLPVEQFMRRYFRRTRDVSNVVTRFVTGARGDSKAARVLASIFSHQVEGDFRVGPSTISATRRGLDKLRGRLSEILRLADLANLYNKRIAHETCEAIRQSAPDLPDEVSPEAAGRFLSLLDQPLRLAELLRLLHDLGVLEKMIPAFGHARCLLQFNEYHKYTVDEHCIRAVDEAARFLNDPGPLGRAYQRIREKRLLHLALLIHDLGKGYEEDHSDVGLRIAENMAERLGLSTRQTGILKFLVHKHLLMSHLAFRRDTSDERLIVQFAVDVGSPAVLRMLYVLTAADFAAVGPGVISSWKIDVLTSLYERTMHHLAGDGSTQSSAGRLDQRRQEVREHLEKDAPIDLWLHDQIEQLPAGYLLERRAEDIARALRSLHDLPAGEVMARGRYQKESRTVEFTVGTYEQITPGVFHKLTGALSGQGLEILSAEICTMAHGLIIDRFVVSDPDHAEQPPAERIESVIKALRDSLQQPGDEPPVFRKVWRSSQQRRAAELCAQRTSVRADNSTSDRYTVLDIFAADRRGLLYTLARTLFELDLSVAVAKIGAYLDQVVDVFYVTDASGNKIEDEQRLQVIRDRLVQSIDQFEKEEAAV